MGSGDAHLSKNVADIIFYTEAMHHFFVTIYTSILSITGKDINATNLHNKLEWSHILWTRIFIRQTNKKVFDFKFYLPPRDRAQCLLWWISWWMVDSLALHSIDTYQTNNCTKKPTLKLKTFIFASKIFMTTFTCTLNPFVAPFFYWYRNRVKLGKGGGGHFLSFREVYKSNFSLVLISL